MAAWMGALVYDFILVSWGFAMGMAGMNSGLATVNIDIPCPHKDRSIPLVFFGSGLLLLGAFCGCLAIATPVGMVLGLPGAQTSFVEVSQVVMAFILYVALMVVFSVLGIGSIRARRWVRSIMMSIGWIWLLVGILTLPALVPGIYQMLVERSSPILDTSVTGLLILIAIFVAPFASILIVVPALFIWFYSRPTVKKTCEDRNPLTSWSDRCPTRVVALAVGLVMVVLALLPQLADPVVPAFGLMMTGWLALVVILFVQTILLILAFWLIQLKPAGWWCTMAVLILVVVGVVVMLLAGEPGSKLAYDWRIWFLAPVSVLLILYTVVIRKSFGVSMNKMLQAE